MNTESNSGMTWPLIFSSLGRSGAAAGQQGISLDVSGGPGESKFQKLMSQFMAGQSLQAAGMEDLSAGSRGETVESGEPDVVSDFLSGLLCADGGSIYQLQGMERGSEGFGKYGGKGENMAKTYAFPEAQTENSLQGTAGLNGAIPLSGADNAALASNGQADLTADMGTDVFPGMNQTGGAAGAQASPIQETGTAEGSQDLQNSKKALNPGLAGPKGPEQSTVFSEGKTDQNGTSEQAISMKPDSSATGKTEPFSPQAGNLREAFPVNNGTAENGQPVEARAGMENESAASTDQLKPEAEAANLRQSVAEYINPLQSTVSESGTAEWNPAVQSVEKAEPYSQIREEILAKLEQKGPAEFKMQLEPEDLGQIDIKLKINEGKLIIDILAASAKTQALLTGQVDKLIAGMGLQNVQVESVQVSQQMTQDQDGQSQNHGMNSAMDFSQRKHQEQFQKEFFPDGNQAASFSTLQAETPDNNPADRAGAYRYGFHRMNYTI